MAQNDHKFFLIQKGPNEKHFFYVIIMQKLYTSRPVCEEYSIEKYLSLILLFFQNDHMNFPWEDKTSEIFFRPLRQGGGWDQVRWGRIRVESDWVTSDKVKLDQFIADSQIFSNSLPYSFKNLLVT
jgi:hypothetical protein